MFEVGGDVYYYFFADICVGPEISTLNQWNEVHSFAFHYSKISFNSRHKLIVWSLEWSFSVMVYGSNFRGEKHSSFTTFRANCSTRFIIPDKNRRIERYRNFSMRLECLLLLHLTYMLPQNDAILIKSQFTKSWTTKTINNKEKNTTPSPQEQSQNSFTSAKNRTKYLRRGHRHQLGNFSAIRVMRVSLMDLHRRFFLQVVTTHSTNAHIRTRARHDQLFVMPF